MGLFGGPHHCRVCAMLLPGHGAVPCGRGDTPQPPQQPPGWPHPASPGAGGYLGSGTRDRKQTSGLGAILRAGALAKPATAQAPFPCGELEGAEGEPEPSECRGGTGEREAGASTVRKAHLGKLAESWVSCLPEDLQQAVLLSLRCPCII